MSGSDTAAKTVAASQDLQAFSNTTLSDVVRSVSREVGDRQVMYRFKDLLDVSSTGVGGVVEAVCTSSWHSFSKQPQTAIRMVEGSGIAGDAHQVPVPLAGEEVAPEDAARHLRHVHLIGIEFLEELRDRGFDLAPGTIGENITTRGVDLVTLPRGTQLRIGKDARIVLNGLRDPCAQLERHQAGLCRAVMDRTRNRPTSRAGVLASVVAGGSVQAGDVIRIELPALPFEPLPPL